MKKRMLWLFTAVLTLGLAGCGTGAQEKEPGYQQITAQEAKTMMDVDAGTIVLDVREQEEYDQGHIPGAVLLPVGEITQESASAAVPEKDTVVLVEYVRSALSRYISYKYSGGQNLLAAYLLDPALEEKIRKSIRQASSGSYLAMDPETVRRILKQVRQTVGNLEQLPQKPVILVSVDIRRYFRKLIEKDYYELPVLSFQELTQEINIQPLGRINA